MLIDPDFPDGSRGADVVEMGRVPERHHHEDGDYGGVDGQVLLVTDVEGCGGCVVVDDGFSMIRSRVVHAALGLDDVSVAGPEGTVRIHQVDISTNHEMKT